MRKTSGVGKAQLLERRKVPGVYVAALSRTEDEGEADKETLRLQSLPVVVAFSRARGQSLKLGSAQVVAPEIAEQWGKVKGTRPTRSGFSAPTSVLLVTLLKYGDKDSGLHSWVKT